MKFNLNLLNLNLKHYMSIASFIAGICFGIAGFCVFPLGEIHSSILILIGLMLIASATFLGIHINIDKQKGKMETNASNE